MTRVIVERRFDGPVSDADLQAIFERQTGCFQIYNVAYVRGNLSMDRLRMICEYEAADTESVRRVQREAGAGFEAIWPAMVVGESSMPP